MYYRTQENISKIFLIIFAGKPLLIVHGWPGSVWEFYKMIPMLTDPAVYGGKDEDAFEVIAPSIPGYGFSEAPHRTGIYLDCYLSLKFHIRVRVITLSL